MENMNTDNVVRRIKKTMPKIINSIVHPEPYLPEIVFITSFPPKVCGIATYSQDLIKSLKKKFGDSFNTMICPIETEDEQYDYIEKTPYRLNTSDYNSYVQLANQINQNNRIELVILQHEFGFFSTIKNGLSQFLKLLEKDIIITFHTVLPSPDLQLKKHVQEIAHCCQSIIVMTEISAIILSKEYGIPLEKINIIAHGTHLLPLTDKTELKDKYDLNGKKVLSTFGLLGSGKNIETTLQALPEIIADHPDVLFLVIGKTHPGIVKNDGEEYRQFLEKTVQDLRLENHVRFVNAYLPLDELLEYLQLTDIYLFTSKDRNQAVSGTFSYAISCGCPIISTPIPHAVEVLKKETGIIIDFESPKQLANEVNKVLKNEQIQELLRTNALEKMAPTAWENSSISHAQLFEKSGAKKIQLQYAIPEINLIHIKNMTTDFGMIQFSKINKPDIDSGYTLDDNARALIAICEHFEQTRDQEDIELIEIYLDFIEFCQQPDGSFLNYVNEEKEFTQQNYETNLEDSNGRAIWALGYLISKRDILNDHLLGKAEKIIQKNLPLVQDIYSTRAMAFIIKGLYYQNSDKNITLLDLLAGRLERMYLHEAKENWHWFESYLTYGNSVLPEAMLCAWMSTGKNSYKKIAIESFQFLLSKIFVNNSIKVISNKGWLQKHEMKLHSNGGEQPIDVAYTILTLSKFQECFGDESHSEMMQDAFNWFLGKNHLNRIIYNPATGGCYDGLEEKSVNLNQGAESTVSYLMARLCLAKA
ncbi:glycosyltransferase [Chryseobacterium chendengshani]|uniref:glycosyltransferase n=1 Tax=Chryseobacterium sp. LJ668 TaxID=2864040 RepID=UPI001C68F836|nr:glycosyltransferase [Chryseobacterium sp. LJ668]MBW8523777.1 glycosyltransferase [Chryseobacterium sp. LJ668]QYK16721.1 glycosyltransferase [Chryseobacterium sp. LJ668]